MYLYALQPLEMLYVAKAAPMVLHLYTHAQEFAELLGHILHGMESECYAVQKMWEARRMYDDELESALTLFEVVRDMQERVSSREEHVY